MLLKHYLTFLFILYFALIDSRRSTGGNLNVVNCPQRTYSTSGINIPASYDLRQYSSCISPIRDQGECGSCWAFASTQALTDRFCIAANSTVKRLLSPQQLVDCDATCQYPLIKVGCDTGCNGGFIDNAWEYMNTTGVTGDSCLPYNGSDGICPSPYCQNDNVIYKSKNCYSLKSITDMQIDILTYGTISAGMQIYDDFYTYTDGVYTVQSTTQEGGHVVRLIGWGVENSVQYWLGANQWTTYWGDNGYFKIRMGTNEAQIESYVVAGEANLLALTTREYVEYPPPAAAGTLYLSFFLIVSLVVMQFFVLN